MIPFRHLFAKYSRLTFLSTTFFYRKLWYTGSWEILARGEGQLREVLVGGECQLGEVPFRERATCGKCHLGDFNLSDFLDISFILTNFYLMNATNDQRVFLK